MSNKEVNFGRLTATLVVLIVLAATIWSTAYLLPKSQNQPQINVSGSVALDQTPIEQRVLAELSKTPVNPDPKLVKQVRNELGSSTKPVSSSTRAAMIKALSK